MSELVFLMGDIHGDWLQADLAYDRARKRFGRPDRLIQVGDYGYYPRPPWTTGMWPREFDHPVEFIDGNHEDHSALRHDMPEGYLPRGTVRDGVLYMGGAYSVDKEYRLANGLHWSPLEDISDEELELVLSYEGDVHTVISHTCPSEFNMEWACSPMFGSERKDRPSRLALQQILEKFRPSQWFFGHWHRAGRGWAGPDQETTWTCLGICEIMPVEL